MSRRNIQEKEKSGGHNKSNEKPTYRTFVSVSMGSLPFPHHALSLSFLSFLSQLLSSPSLIVPG